MSNILCLIFEHKYKVTRRINAGISELECGRCKKQFAINTFVKALLPLDGELIDLHNDILTYAKK